VVTVASIETPVITDPEDVESVVTTTIEAETGPIPILSPSESTTSTTPMLALAISEPETFKSDDRAAGSPLTVPTMKSHLLSGIASSSTHKVEKAGTIMKKTAGKVRASLAETAASMSISPKAGDSVKTSQSKGKKKGKKNRPAAAEVSQASTTGSD